MKKKTQTRFFIKLNFSKMGAFDIKSCNLCKKEHDKLFKPSEKVLGTQLSSVIKTILGNQQLKFPQKFLICAECSMMVIQTEIVFKRLEEALTGNKTENEKAAVKKSTTTKNVKSEKIQEQQQHEQNARCDISKIDGNEKDEDTALDTTVNAWIFNCRHCNFATETAKLYRNHLSEKHNVYDRSIYHCMLCKESYVGITGIKNHIAYVHEKKPRKPRQRRSTIALDTPPLSSTKIGDQLKSDVTLVDATKVNEVEEDTKLGETIKTATRQGKLNKATKMKKTTEDTKFKEKPKSDTPLVKEAKAKKLEEKAKTDAVPANQSTEQTKSVYELKCEHCEYKTLNAKLFKKHLKNKHDVEDTKIYKCNQCANKYMLLYALQNHIAYTHENKPRPPPQRRKSVPPDFEPSTAPEVKLMKLIGEINHEENANEFKCEMCAYEAKDDKNLKQHMVIKHQKDNMDQNSSALEEDEQHKDDEYVFRKPHSMTKEAKKDEVTNDWIFRCPHCTFESTKRKAYKTHIKGEHDLNDENIYKCIYCAGAYKRYNLLQSHVANKHSIDLTLISDEPPPIYPESSQDEIMNGFTPATKKKRKLEKQAQQTKADITADVTEIETPTKFQKFENVTSKTAKLKESCVVCGKQFSTLDKLRSHMDKNHGDDVIKHCANCYAQFRSIEKYEAHLFSEKCLDTNSFACQSPDCAKRFNTYAKFKQHMLEKHSIHCPVELEARFPLGKKRGKIPIGGLFSSLCANNTSVAKERDSYISD